MSARSILALVALVILVACEVGPSEPEVTPDLAKPGGDEPIEVTGTDPASAPQDTTIEMQVTGSGFEQGATVALLLDDLPAANVSVARTRFVSSTVLLADVTIELEAAVDAYDVEVKSKNGRRRGVGTELFSVTLKTNNGTEAGPVTTTVLDEPGVGVASDGLGAYAAETKGRKSIESDITSDGRHWLQLEPHGTRQLCLTFPDAGPDVEILSPADWQDLVDRSGGAIDYGSTYCDRVTFHTRNHSDPDKLFDMDLDAGTATVDDVQTSGGKIALGALDNGGPSWEWRLTFEDREGPLEGPQEGLCIRYFGTSWTIGNDASLDDTSENPAECDGVDDVMDLIRMTGFETPPVIVARLRMPFRYTVTPR